MSTFGIYITLSHVQPEVHSEFQTGNFVIHKSSNVLSGMSIDQAQEQNNNMVKGPWHAMGYAESHSLHSDVDGRRTWII